MNGSDLVAVILAGGAGTRFWPLSTEGRPKQFLRLLDDKSLLRASFERIAGIVDSQRILVMTNREFVKLVQKELPEVPESNILGEPCRRDTAAAVCLAALVGKKRWGNPVMAVLTADHLIWPLEDFHRVLLSASQMARQTGALYTLGISPSHPATGYGYLELGEMLLEHDGVRHFQVRRFMEKPDLETATEFVSSGRFMWNSGMFIWTVEAVIQEMRLHLPSHLEELSRAVEKLEEPGWEKTLQKAFDALESISVDYGVMEKASNVRCAVGSFRWSDVGGWSAMVEFLPKDSEGNAFRGKLFGEDSEGNLVFCENEQETVALLGVHGLIVVRAGEKTLVARMDKAEQLKTLVNKFKEKLDPR